MKEMFQKAKPGQKVYIEGRSRHVVRMEPHVTWVDFRSKWCNPNP
jgi:hypothetical protein